MTQPFFSIIIPTKNRPHLLWDAMRSVLWQDFDDYELIVSDNFNDERTKQVVDEFLGNPHLKYIRTDKELNMPDHWEFATKRAVGKYVLILADRSLLMHHALKELHKIITESPEDILVYAWQNITYEKGMQITRLSSSITRKLDIISSKQLLDEYGKTAKADYRYPVGVNSCYKNELGELIRSRHGRLFWPINPDAFSSFLLLYYTDRIACIGKPLYVSQGVAESNGRMVNMYGPHIYVDTLDKKYWYRHVPIRAPLVENFAFDDYLEATAMAGKDFSMVDWASYFLSCYRELIYKASLGGRWWQDHKDEILKEWERALSNFDKEVQKKVKKEMRKIKLVFTAKSLLARSKMLPLLRKIQNIFLYRYPALHFATALEAAGFKS
jgi:glycosyltransferase involved in cell wall biosynthesis